MVAATVSWQVAQYILLCLFATLVESSTSTGCMHANGSFLCAWQQRNWHLNNILGWKTVIRARIARISLTAAVDPDMVKSTIIQYMYFVHKRVGIVCFVCHEWLRSDLKIRCSISSNKHGTGKADEIFTEIWRDSFSLRMLKFSENPIRIPRDSRRGLT